MAGADESDAEVGRASKHCLDLFVGLGGFSAAFRGAEDWTVTTVEIAERFDPDICADVLDLRPSDLLDVVDDADHLVVLAGHPCTYLTYIRRVTTGGDDAWEDGDPATPECRDHVAMVHHTVGLIEGLAPDYWFLENPRGHMREVLGPPDSAVWYCQYGHENAKPTDLWGNHPPTFTPQKCAHGNDDCDHVKTESCKEHGGGSDNRQGILTEGDSAERAEVPYELSEAIRHAVDEALAAETVDRQADLSEVVARVE